MRKAYRPYFRAFFTFTQMDGLPFSQMNMNLFQPIVCLAFLIVLQHIDTIELIIESI